MLKQFWTVVLLGLRTIPSRKGASLVIVIGMACAVGALVSIQSMSAGLNRQLNNNGRADRGWDRPHDREVLAVAPADPGGDARGGEALGGGDAHRPTPGSCLAFCICDKVVTNARFKTRPRGWVLTSAAKRFADGP